MAELTYAQIMEQRHKEDREHRARLKRWAAEVTEQLENERSSFIEEFTAEDRRLFGVDQCKA